MIGIATWARALFATPLAAILTLASGAIMAWLGWQALSWLLLQAVWPWQPAAACDVRTGLCWPFLVEKTRLILFGTYPFGLQWRATLASLLLLALAVLTGFQMIGRTRLHLLAFLAIWLGGLGVAVLLLGGGALGLPDVPSVYWNGLPILLFLAIASIAGAFPVGVLLALARDQSAYPLLWRFATIYIEVARGVPMLTVIFVGIFVLPLTLPPGTSIAPVSAVLIALIFFHGAYIAEDLRGGLQSLSKGQREAAKSLGLGYWQSMGLVVLPQAITRSLPSLVNSIIGAYKDTSLVVIVGIHDLISTARMSFNDPEWRGHALEAYLFVGLWFFLSCAFLSAIGRRLHTDRETAQTSSSQNR
ncbi:amino acid ABC transporter permease [Bauldia sp.]|uniref:amino acid ABC transporter permease n=1 Tax=Bauldia sp. TaxID=2575872 RepID=UPI003BAA21DA